MGSSGISMQRSGALEGEYIYVIAVIVPVRPFLQLNELISIKPSRNLPLRIRLRDDERIKCWKYFSLHPLENHLHIVVDLPSFCE